MNRVEFMKELEHLLSDISDAELKEALQYYNDYLDDAGEDNEEEVIESLGSPDKVAANIKAGLSGNEDGEFTETGYKDCKEEQENTITQWQSCSKTDNNGSGRTKSHIFGKDMSGAMMVLLIIVCVLFGPAIIGVAIGALATVFGILAAVLAVVVATFAIVVSLAVALTVTGILVFVMGIIHIFTKPVGGCLLLGLGILCFGVGLFFTAITVWSIAKAIPALIRFTVDTINALISKMKGVRR